MLVLPREVEVDAVAVVVPPVVAAARTVARFALPVERAALFPAVSVELAGVERFDRAAVVAPAA